MSIPAHARTVDALLQTKGYTLPDFIADKLDEGISWRLIARSLYEFTDGVVDVTHQTVANWHDAYRQRAAS